MTKCYVVHRADKNNVGDIASNPLQYFMNEDDYTVVDITQVGYTFFEDKPVVMGGGGLIANEFFEDHVRDLLVPSDKNQILNLANQYWRKTSAANKRIRDEFFNKLNPLVNDYVNKLELTKSPRIIWGAGHNGEYQKKLQTSLEYPAWIRNFNLIGIRDYGQQYNWVPCASCMHPALRKKYAIKNDIIWFEHKKQLIKSNDFGKDSIPRFINSGSNIDQTIELLGSANIIITNSYHGAYWGTLLKKKVILVDAWSSKFNAMRHRPYFLSKGDYWRDIIDDIYTYPEAIEECIDATENYWKHVKQFIK